MKYVSLTKIKYALVDDEDYEFLKQYKWAYHKGYAVRTEYYKKPCKKRVSRTIHMHRVLNNTPDGMETDHINGDRLDNRKSNLRSCTTSQNAMNQKSSKNSASKFKGVFKCKKRVEKKWTSSIMSNGKKKNLGYFETEIEAAEAYNKAAKEYHGEFARLNDV